MSDQEDGVFITEEDPEADSQENSFPKSSNTKKDSPRVNSRKTKRDNSQNQNILKSYIDNLKNVIIFNEKSIHVY